MKRSTLFVLMASQILGTSLFASEFTNEPPPSKKDPNSITWDLKAGGLSLQKLQNNGDQEGLKAEIRELQKSPYPCQREIIKATSDLKSIVTSRQSLKPYLKFGPLKVDVMLGSDVAIPGTKGTELKQYLTVRVCTTTPASCTSSILPLAGNSEMNTKVAGSLFPLEPTRVLPYETYRKGTCSNLEPVFADVLSQLQSSAPALDDELRRITRATQEEKADDLQTKELQKKAAHILDQGAH